MDVKAELEKRTVGALAGAQFPIESPQELLAAFPNTAGDPNRSHLKIARIRVHHFRKARPGEEAEARRAMEQYIERCPAAQGVIGCVPIDHDLTIEPG